MNIKAKVTTTIILILAFIAYFYYYYNVAYVAFQPTLFRYNDNKGYYKIKVNQDFYKNLNQVLTYYFVGHKFENGKIWTHRKTSNDIDLIWNYTEKALDKEWLANH